MRAQEVTLDLQRQARIGLEEAIFCMGKTEAQLVHILEVATREARRLLLTRLSAEQHRALPAPFRETLEYDPVSGTAFLGPLRVAEPSRVSVIAAGSSDAHVFREVERSLRYYGYGSTPVLDVGVAGLWRLLDRLEEIRSNPVTIVVAGMDAALPTVVGGLVGSVVIGVPTSNGYGVAAGGSAALNSMLASCAPGVTVMNIDNGYGAACAAIRVLRAIDGFQVNR